MVTTIANAGNLTPEEKARAEKKGTDLGKGAVDLGNGAVDLVKSAGKTASDGAKVVTDAGAGVVKQVKEKGIWGTISEGASSAWNGILGFLGMTGDPEKDKKGLNVGSLMGGFLGAGGAWAISQFFGGGIIGTIAMIAFIPMGIIIGTQFGDKNINPLIGREPRGTAPAKAQAQAQTPAQAPAASTEVAQSSIDWSQIHNEYVAPRQTGQVFGNVAAVSYSPQQQGQFVPTPQTPVVQVQGASGPIQPGQPLGWRIGG
ncbi:MAG: hypothetical protein ACKVOE_02555 [Rickettsiales bacterium]